MASEIRAAVTVGVAANEAVSIAKLAFGAAERVGPDEDKFLAATVVAMVASADIDPVGAADELLADAPGSAPCQIPTRH